MIGHDLARRPVFLAVVEGDHRAGLPWLFGIATRIANDARAAAEAQRLLLDGLARRLDDLVEVVLVARLELLAQIPDPPQRFVRLGAVVRVHDRREPVGLVGAFKVGLADRPAVDQLVEQRREQRAASHSCDVGQLGQHFEGRRGLALGGGEVLVLQQLLEARGAAVPSALRNSRPRCRARSAASRIIIIVLAAVVGWYVIFGRAQDGARRSRQKTQCRIIF